METVTDFIFLGFKITADGDCSHKINRHLLLGRKALKNLGKVKLLSRVQLFVTPWTVAYWALPSMGFSGQRYWTGLPFPSPEDLPDPGIEPRSTCIEGRHLTLWATREARQHIKKQRHHFANEDLSSQSYGFSSSDVRMWELGSHKEGWAPKNWCFWTMGPEKTLESPLDSKEIKPVYLKGNQPWIFIGRTDAVIEAPNLWPPDANC